MSLKDRNLIFEQRRSYSFGFTVSQKLIRIGAYLALHDTDSFSGDDREHLSTKFFRELENAWADVSDNLVSATDPSYWNIDHLLTRKETFRGTQSFVRKPKIIINSEITQAGNLSVKWYPDDDRDYRRFADYTPAWGRPLNEIMFIRQFSSAARTYSHLGNWEAAMRSFIVETCIEAIAEVVEIAKRHCEVEVDWQVVLELNEDGHAVGYHHTNAKQREAQRLVPYLEERNELEQRYGMMLTKIVSLSNAYSREGVQYPRIAKVLQQNFGMLEQRDGKQFRAVVAEMRDLLRNLGEDIPDTTLSDDEKSYPAQFAVSRPVTEPHRTTAEKTAVLLERVAATRRGKQPSVQAPLYPTHVYQASPDELERLGVSSTNEIIDRINERMRNEGRHPISIADYPVNKKLFDRMCIRFEKLGLISQVKNDQTPA